MVEKTVMIFRPQVLSNMLAHLSNVSEEAAERISIEEITKYHIQSDGLELVSVIDFKIVDDIYHVKVVVKQPA